MAEETPPKLLLVRSVTPTLHYSPPPLITPSPSPTVAVPPSPLTATPTPTLYLWCYYTGRVSLTKHLFRQRNFFEQGCVEETLAHENHLRTR